MSFFNEWYKNADMPTRGEDGRWYDAEDGSTYSDYARAKAARAASKAARVAGWPALSGTEKQRAWAASIRQELIASTPPAARDIAARMSTDAGWWIQHRDKTAFSAAVQAALNANGDK